MDEKFDIDAWLSDAELPETVVRVNKYGHLAARLKALQEEHDAAKRAESGDVRLTSKGSRSRELADEIAAVREQMESGWLSIRLRGLTGDELDRVNKAKDAEAKTILSLSLQAVEPRLDGRALKALRDKIGVGQWSHVVEEAGRVAFGEVRTPDFSASVLASLATGGSSKS